jgi:hypothetical protein
MNVRVITSRKTINNGYWSSNVGTLVAVVQKVSMIAASTKKITIAIRQINANVVILSQLLSVLEYVCQCSSDPSITLFYIDCHNLI